MVETTALAPLHLQVAMRLRGVMGEQRISQEKLRILCGWNRGYMTRRYTGETPLDVNDMETLERCAGISMVYLLTGEKRSETTMPHPHTATAQASTNSGTDSRPDPAQYLRQRVIAHQRGLHTRLPLPRKDSNLQPFGYRRARISYATPCISHVNRSPRGH